MSYGRGFEGAAYRATERLDITEIAKRVRVGLKNAAELGALPEGMTWKVTIDRFSGGQSLDVRLSGMPDSWQFVSPGLPADYPNGVKQNGGDTPEATAVVELVKSMVDSYNYDDSDAMTDYFNVRFWGHVRIEDERAQHFNAVEADVKAAQRAASAARKAAGLPTKGKAAQIAASRVAREVRLAAGVCWA